MFYKTTYLSPLGNIMIAGDGKSVSGVWLEGQKYFADTVLQDMKEKDDIPVFIKTKEWLNRYFAGENPSIDELPLAPQGNSFRQAVWKILCEIPYGKTITYGEIARKIAKQMNKTSMSAQAVGGAVGHNPVSIIIPCHRVVGAGGNLTGYAGGIDIKIKLLKLEGVDMSKFYDPSKKSRQC